MKDKCVDIFKALSDATRQEILQMLKEHELNVTDICRAFEQMTQPTISHHLQILRHCELVQTRREGKMIFYCINKKILHDEISEFFVKIDIEL